MCQLIIVVVKGSITSNVSIDKEDRQPIEPCLAHATTQIIREKLQAPDGSALTRCL